MRAPSSNAPRLLSGAKMLLAASAIAMSAALSVSCSGANPVELVVPRTLSDIVSAKAVSDVCDEEQDELRQYATAQYSSWSGTRGSTANTRISFHSADGDELFSIVVIGNRDLVEIGGSLYQMRGTGADISGEAVAEAMSERYGKSFSAGEVSSPMNQKHVSVSLDGDSKTYSVKARERADGSVELFDDYYWKHRRRELEGVKSRMLSAAFAAAPDSAAQADFSASGSVSHDVPLDAGILDDSVWESAYYTASVDLYGNPGLDEQDCQIVLSQLECLIGLSSRGLVTVSGYPDCPTDADLSAYIEENRNGRAYFISSETDAGE